MSKNQLFSPIVEVKVMVVGVQSPQNRSIDATSYFKEFKNLIESCGFVDYDEHFIKLRSIDAGSYFTKGKLEELMRLCKEYKPEVLYISEPLATQQIRNLTKLLDIPVFDRTGLILEIFKRGAQTAEGKLQVELAMLLYQKSQLAGRGVHMSQQAGDIGMRGPGETEKEKETRVIEYQLKILRGHLDRLQTIRATQRKHRLTNAVPHISLIGYTNSGKSTILNALTKSSVLAENKLFATLDTTTRELFIGSVKKGTIADTVGFIQNLPHQLIEAFKSTLSDLSQADLLLQVVDVSDKNWRNHIRVVHKILEELKVANKPMLYVFNKFDLVEKLAEMPEEALMVLPDEDLEGELDVATPLEPFDELRTNGVSGAETGELEEELESPVDEPMDKLEDLMGLLEKYQPHVVVSALSKAGLAPLVNWLGAWKGGEEKAGRAPHAG